MNALKQNVSLPKIYTQNDEWSGSRPCRFKPIGIKIVPQILHEPKLDAGRKHYYINQESDYNPSLKPSIRLFNQNICQDTSNNRKCLRKIMPNYSEPKYYYSRVINVNPKRDNINNKNSVSYRSGIQIINTGDIPFRNTDITYSTNNITRNLYKSVDYTSNRYDFYDNVVNEKYDRLYVSKLDDFDKRLKKYNNV